MRLTALDEFAEKLGLRKEQGVAEARAMYPALDVVEEDPAADRRLLEAIADWCDRYTPMVALDGRMGCFWILPAALISSVGRGRFFRISCHGSFIWGLMREARSPRRLVFPGLSPVSDRVASWTTRRVSAC